MFCFTKYYYLINRKCFMLFQIIFETNNAEITIVIISPILFTSYAAFAAALAAFSFAAFLSAIDCLTAVNTATQIPNTKNAPIG